MAYHMVFDNKKWYEGLMPNYIGKHVIVPKDLKLHGYQNDWQHFYHLDENETADLVSLKNNAVIIAQGKNTDSNKIFILPRYSNGTFWIAVDEFLENGGVSASAKILTIADRKAVAA